MKHILVSVFFIGSVLLPTSNAFGIIGFGLYGGADQFQVDENTSLKESEYSQSVVTQYPFDQAYSVGGYLYLDVLPIVDLELEYQLTGGVYNFNYQVFSNDLLLAETGKDEMPWAKGSFYLTVRKKLFGLGIPILGGAKVHAGAGVNSHTSIPILDINEVEKFRGDNLYTEFNPGDMQDEIIDYVKENIITTTGGHFQAGLQMSFLAFDVFVNYRYTMAEIFPDKSGYSSLNVMLGLGF